MATLPTLTDGSLPQLYDCALNAVGYRVGWQIVKNLAFRHDPYSEVAKDIVVEKNDTSVEEMTENKVDALYWESQRSWHEGAGQVRFDDPKLSSPYAFYSNTNTNVTNKGLAYLLPDSRVAATSGYVNGIMIESGGFLFQETSATSLPFTKVALPANDSSSFVNTTFTPNRVGAISISDACSDGQNFYVAYSNVDIHSPSTNLAASGFSGISWGPASGTGITTNSTAAFGTGSTAPDVGSVAFVKGRLVAAGPIAGDATGRWRFWQAATDPTPSTEVIVLPAGFTVPRHCIVEIAGFVLFAAVSSHYSVIYAWDGFTTPYVCCYLPEGDQVMCMSSYLGVEVCIGVRRLKSTGTSVGNGALFVGQATAAGQLALSEVFEMGDGSIILPLDPNNPTGSTDSLDYAIHCLASRGRYTYFNWGRAPAVGVYDHANQSFSRANSFGPSTGVPVDIAVCSRRLAVSMSTGGGAADLYVENISKLIPTGTIVGSLMDWNIDKLKSVAQAQFGTLPLPAGTSVTMDYSLDNNQTFTNILTMNTTGATMVQTTNTLTSQFLQTVPVISYRINLNSDPGTRLLTPILKKVGFGAWYGEKPKKTWTVAVDIGDGQTLKNGAPFVLIGGTPVMQGNSPSLWQLLLNNVRNLWASQAVVSWQPPGYGDTHNDIFVVQVRGYTAYRWYESAAGFGGIVFVELKEAP